MPPTTPKTPKTNHLINSIENAVQESLLGLCKTNPEIQLIKEYNVVIRKDLSDFEHQNGKPPRRKVALISGGGSGHEPFAAGLVGENGVDAAVSGDIFASPSSLSVLGAIQQFPKSTGILLVLNNYTGDRLNFGIAIERAHLLGYSVDMCLAADDCAFHEPTDADRALENRQIDESVIPKSKLNTRGLAGVYFMIRLANVMAKNGLDLKELKTRLRNYSELITTYSVSLNSCDIPGVGRSFNIGNLQMELGLGMHGELGAKRSSLEPLHCVVERMLNHIVKNALTDKLSKRLDQLPADKLDLIVLVNNLGGLSQFELSIVCNELIEQLSKMSILIKPDRSYQTKELLLDRSCRIARLFAGTYLTSFAMHAVSITILPKIDNELIRLIDAVESTSIKSSNGLLNDQPLVKPKYVENQQTKELIDDLSAVDELFTKSLTSACCALLHSKDELNRLDSELGDSDCGSTMAVLAQNLLKEYVRNEEGLNASFYRVVKSTGHLAGGTSGVIYSLLLTGIAEAMAEQQYEYRKKHNKELPLDDFAVWGQVLEQGVRTVMKYSLAGVGDRTLLDVLYPIAEYLLKIDSTKLSPEEKYRKLDELSKLVVELADKTAELVPRCGRASYAANRGKCVDPGARGVQHWFNAVLETIKQTQKK